jgi:hypothetical protein
MAAHTDHRYYVLGGSKNGGAAAGESPDLLRLFLGVAQMSAPEENGIQEIVDSLDNGGVTIDTESGATGASSVANHMTDCLVDDLCKMARTVVDVERSEMFMNLIMDIRKNASNGEDLSPAEKALISFFFCRPNNVFPHPKK